jgi:hypothetical protein
MTQDSGDTTLIFDNQICFPQYSAANAMMRVYSPLLKELDITYLQYMVLMLLWEKNLKYKKVRTKNAFKFRHVNSTVKTA